MIFGIGIDIIEVARTHVSRRKEQGGGCRVGNGSGWGREIYVVDNLKRGIILAPYYSEEF